MTLQELEDWISKATYIDTTQYETDSCGNSEGIKVFVVGDDSQCYGIYFHNNGIHKDRYTEKYTSDENGYGKRIDGEYDIIKLKPVKKVIEITEYEEIEDGQLS